MYVGGMRLVGGGGVVGGVGLKHGKGKLSKSNKSVLGG